MTNKPEAKIQSHKDTIVKIHFPDEISIELVQANELRHYEIFTWSASLLATIAVGFWTAYFTTSRSSQLLWTAITASAIFVLSLGVAIYYRRKVYHGSLIKTTTLADLLRRGNNMTYPTNPSSRAGLTTGHRKLGEVCEISSGVSVPKAEMKSVGKFKIIKNRDYNENEISWHNDENGWTDREVSENKLLKVGDSLLINAAHNKSHVASKTGYVVMLKYPRVVTSGEVMVIRAKKGLILPEIIHFQLQNSVFINQLKELIDGIHLYPKDVANIKIPLPPIAEQRKIVARLEGLLGKIKETKRLRAGSETAAQNLLPAELHLTI
ncbi:MAG: restriction endonuclease subunit S [Candidatus Zambryskibacteria bacterium]|nr:restriction endonuclease subunit S [Candidatus Zambryskibacteria bacterium]